MALRPTLPLHFLWSDMDMSQMLDLEEQPELRRSFYSPDGARQEKSELDKELSALLERLSAEAPAYGEARRSVMSVARVASMLSRHRPR